jgi:N-formylglutamate deformylase
MSTGGSIIVSVDKFPVSRLLVDPERFADDAQECMSAVGMGVLYNLTSNGELLRDTQFTNGEYRDQLLERFYFPHHQKLTKMVEEELRLSGTALIVDCHSFPNKPLPYELDQNPNRPQVCIGTDDFHTPPELSEKLKKGFVEYGYDVRFNTPFSGAIVPCQVPCGYLPRKSYPYFRARSIFNELANGSTAHGI